MRIALILLTFVCQDESSRLKSPLLGDRAPLHVCSETDRAGALSRGEDRSGGGLLHVLEELRLGGARVSAQQHINVPAHPVLLAGVLCLS